MELAERVSNGDVRALARVITLVENNTAQGREALRELHHRTGHSHVIGITGAPGSGKSTLVTQLAKEFRRREQTVGVVAVDPSSAITGGAVLGDRVRMQELWSDPGVYIRSMATRGALGGLAQTTGEVVTVLDAFGKDVVLVETVGVGQDEVEIASAAHTTLVVDVPGLGDDVQAMKAGVLEIADVFVVNKADREGVDRLIAQLQALLSLGQPKPGWDIPILKTIATQNQGLGELADKIEAHWRFLRESGRLEQLNRDRARSAILTISREELMARLLRGGRQDGQLDKLIAAVVSGETDPYSAAEQLVQRVCQVA